MSIFNVFKGQFIDIIEWNEPSQNDILPKATMTPFARLTHQGEHLSALARNGILSRMPVIRLDRLTRRRKLVHPL